MIYCENNKALFSYPLTKVFLIVGFYVWVERFTGKLEQCGSRFNSMNTLVGCDFMIVFSNVEIVLFKRYALRIILIGPFNDQRLL